MQNTDQRLGMYTQHQRDNEDSRETDKRALLICAGQLQYSVDSGSGDMSAYQESLKKNQKLWTMFQVALTDPENELPRDLKILLLNLSRYIDKVSFQAIASFNPDLVRSLININRMIAEGLATSLRTLPGAIEQTQQQQPAAALDAQGDASRRPEIQSANITA